MSKSLRNQILRLWVHIFHGESGFLSFKEIQSMLFYDGIHMV